ncbi:MAG: NADP-dependent oxidoreductase [Rhodospirillaceae bacterium]|nr:NADP-dependent oxidoreductase [Rhodospirillaceae bacterium]MBT4672961.1 NADP-dependent oxidoreductase [Rhodospirillaceae bacterium]MBT4720541.1 NADP-dependent oxidoreductase [Rhodospirillaceae bacterium]MBT5178234.1 NADP-dependent oxidoreductase [Rhodospirillaceae bacterium]MBT6292353.1 NADP-dependent oxidoreductase [Rhodospirillaceae bacterium]
MSNIKNRRWVLNQYPDGMPGAETFRLEEDLSLADLKDGEILVAAKYLSVDPYMRGRISPAKNYAPGIAPGELMTGGGVGEVIESRSDKFKVGDFAESMGFGWQAFAVLDGNADGVARVDADLAPIESALGWLGMPGRTAYFGLFHVAQIQPGDCVVISAASGAVGQVAGQLAKAHGCRTVAVASSQAKLDWCAEIGFDAGVNYRDAGDDLPAVLGEACPDGVDVYFDNTSGPIQDAVMLNLALGARIALCGTIALSATFGAPDIGLRLNRQLLINRSRMQGFLVTDFAAYYGEANQALAAARNAGNLKFREDVMDGIEAMPEAFLKLLTSDNFGKQLIKI